MEQVDPTPPSEEHSLSLTPDVDEFRRFAIRTLRDALPDFRFLTYATGVCHFQRVRDFYDFDLKQGLHLVADPQSNVIHCSVSSRINPGYMLSPLFSNQILNRHRDIKELTGDPSPYLYDEQLATSLSSIVNDFTTWGIPFQQQHLVELSGNNNLKKGLDLIDTWEHDKAIVKNQIERMWKRNKADPARLRHALCHALRNELMNFPQTPESTEQMPQLIFELLELYCGARFS